jgi:hypothetical protein
MSLISNIGNLVFETNRPKIRVGQVIRRITSYLYGELTRNIKE